MKKNMMVILSLLIPGLLMANPTYNLSAEETTKLKTELQKVKLNGAMVNSAVRADLNNQDLKDLIIVPLKGEDTLTLVSVSSAELKKNLKPNQNIETKNLGKFTLASDGQFNKFERPLVEDFDGDGKTDIGSLITGKNLATGKPMYVVYVLLQETNGMFTKVPVITLDKKPASENDVAEAIKAHLGKSVK